MGAGKLLCSLVVPERAPRGCLIIKPSLLALDQFRRRSNPVGQNNNRKRHRRRWSRQPCVGQVAQNFIEDLPQVAARVQKFSGRVLVDQSSTTHMMEPVHVELRDRAVVPPDDLSCAIAIPMIA